MGMSASQARFLSVTARKSNVEFQGQQINQQRTSLANESAGLFNQMLELQVPTPPSATDFYSMAYTFPGETASEECRITNWGTSSNPEMGSYNVTATKTINDIGVKQPTIPIGTIITQTIGADNKPVYSMQIPDNNGNMIKYALENSDKDVNGIKAEDNNADYIQSYSYSKGGRTYFVAESLLTGIFNGNNSTYNITDNDGVKSTVITEENQETAKESYYKGEKTVESITYIGVTMETDDNGRFIGMKYSPTNDPNNMIYVDLTIQEVKDDAGYDAAMAEYNYKKMLYDRTIDDINTRTEIIQRQDLNLELNLKQLDTEQEALSKEYDAIKQVIDKNVETTFKTFG